MMNSLKNKIVLGLTAFAMAVGASAQTAAAGGSASAPAQQDRAAADHAKWAENMKARMAEHQAAFHDKLKITAAQEPAWKEFIAAAQPTAMPMHKPEDRQAMEKLSTPDQMEKSLQMMKERQARMETRLAAVKKFYAVLTPEQRGTFDEMHRRMAMRMHAGFGGGQHGWHGHQGWHHHHRHHRHHHWHHHGGDQQGDHQGHGDHGNWGGQGDHSASGNNASKTKQ